MNILFLDQKDPVIGNVTVQDPHHVLIENTEKNLSGFHLVTDEGKMCIRDRKRIASCWTSDQRIRMARMLWI